MPGFGNSADLAIQGSDLNSLDPGMPQFRLSWEELLIAWILGHL